MSILFEAEGILKNIESHSHYGPCLNGYRFSDFSQRRDNLRTCMDYNNVLKDLKEQIISEYNKLKLEKKKKNQSIELQGKQLEIEKQKFNDKKEIEIKNNENLLEKIKKEEETKLNKELNEIKNIENDIKKSKDIFENLEGKLEVKIDYKKEEILNSLKNKYELKLSEYENYKEIEQREKEAEIRRKKKEIETQKEVELYELKNKAYFVQKIINSLRNVYKIY